MNMFTKFAILNTNYISKRLEKHFPTLYRSNSLVAHECILDLRAFKSVTAKDVAKRLMDYNAALHARNQLQHGSWVLQLPPVRPVKGDAS